MLTKGWCFPEPPSNAAPLTKAALQRIGFALIIAPPTNTSDKGKMCSLFARKSRKMQGFNFS